MKFIAFMLFGVIFVLPGCSANEADIRMMVQDEIAKADIRMMVQDEIAKADIGMMVQDEIAKADIGMMVQDEIAKAEPTRGSQEEAGLPTNPEAMETDKDIITAKTLVVQSLLVVNEDGEPVAMISEQPDQSPSIRIFSELSGDGLSRSSAQIYGSGHGDLVLVGGNGHTYLCVMEEGVGECEVKSNGYLGLVDSD